MENQILKNAYNNLKNSNRIAKNKNITIYYKNNSVFNIFQRNNILKNKSISLYGVFNKPNNSYSYYTKNNNSNENHINTYEQFRKVVGNTKNIEIITIGGRVVFSPQILALLHLYRKLPKDVARLVGELVKPPK